MHAKPSPTAHELTQPLTFLVNLYVYRYHLLTFSWYLDQCKVFISRQLLDTDWCECLFFFIHHTLDISFQTFERGALRELHGILVLVNINEIRNQ